MTRERKREREREREGEGMKGVNEEKEKRERERVRERESWMEKCYIRTLMSGREYCSSAELKSVYLTVPTDWAGYFRIQDLNQSSFNHQSFKELYVKIRAI